MPAEYARFKRAEFQAALKKREQQLSNSGCYPVFCLVWMLGTAAVFRMFAAAFEREPDEQRWWHILPVPLLFLVILGPPIFLPYLSRRALRPFLKCPHCKGPTYKHDNQHYILATGKCGWCGGEVLEPAPFYEPSIPPMAPTRAFEKISLPDLVAEQVKNAPWGRKHITALVLSYAGGLLLFVALTHGAAAYGMPTVSSVCKSLGVFWLLFSPRLLQKLVRRRQVKQSGDCPHCRQPLNHMLAIVTGRCGSCGVQIVADEERRFTSVPLSKDESSPKEQTQEDFGKLSRSEFRALRHPAAEERHAGAANIVMRILPFLGSSLVVVIVSILFLPAPWVLVVPVAWILGAGVLQQFIFRRQLQRISQSRSQSTKAMYFNCPACGKSTEGLNGSFLTTTGRCGECLRPVLDDDTARVPSQA